MTVSVPRQLRWGDIEFEARPKWHVHRRIEPTHSVTLDLELTLFAADPVDAVSRIRALIDTEPLYLGEARSTSIVFRRAELYLAGQPPDGRAWLDVNIEPSIPFVYEPGPPLPEDRISFEKALQLAEAELGNCPIHLDRIEENDRWWWFPTIVIGIVGAVVNRRTGTATGFGSGLGGDLEGMFWAYERGLVDGTSCAIRIDEVVESQRERVADAVAAFAGLVAAGVAIDLKKRLPCTYEQRPGCLAVGGLFAIREFMRFVILDTEGREIEP